VAAGTATETAVATATQAAVRTATAHQQRERLTGRDRDQWHADRPGTEAAEFSAELVRRAALKLSIAVS
jgi:hypothetical protein